MHTLLQLYLASLSHSSCKGRKECLLIFCTAEGIRNTDAGKDSGFIDIKSIIVIFENFKCR